MIELVDIGGPAMIRAAAKNHTSVIPLIDPADYERIANYLKEGEVPLTVRRELAAKVFAELANYNLEIARYFSGIDQQPSVDSSSFTPYQGMLLKKKQELRYGENPHQKAALYQNWGESSESCSWQQLSGKDLSYNNLLDFDAALSIISSFDSDPTAVIVKHLNPCGVASNADLAVALKMAKQGDPRSHFGGIVAFNRSVTENVAEELREGFVEIVLAPDYGESALALLKKRKNLRIIKVDFDKLSCKFDLRAVEGGVLVQERDPGVTKVSQAEVVSSRQPSSQKLEVLQFAWNVCSHVKSNAIVLAKDKMILSVGAGQMSRVDSAELALSKASHHGHDLDGAVAASDAFFPFADSVELLIKAGVKAIVTPGGSKRDEEIKQAVDDLGASLIFMNERHFRH